MSTDADSPDDGPDSGIPGAEVLDDGAPRVFRGLHLDVEPVERAGTPQRAESSEPSDALRGEPRTPEAPLAVEALAERFGQPPLAAQLVPARLDFDSFYLEHHDRVLGAVRCFCAGDHALAEDVTQETFLQAYKRQAYLATVAEPYVWLLVVARNTARRYFRREGQRRDKEHDLHVLVSRGGAESEIWRLVDLLERLTEPDERKVIWYRYVLGYERKTIAEKLRVSLRTVDYLITRALRRIRRALDLEEEGER